MVYCRQVPRSRAAHGVTRLSAGGNKGDRTRWRAGLALLIANIESHLSAKTLQMDDTKITGW